MRISGASQVEISVEDCARSLPGSARHPDRGAPTTSRRSRTRPAHPLLRRHREGGRFGTRFAVTPRHHTQAGQPDEAAHPFHFIATSRTASEAPCRLRFPTPAGAAPGLPSSPHQDAFPALSS